MKLPPKYYFLFSTILGQLFIGNMFGSDVYAGKEKFLEVVASKKEVYIGEGIDIKYYLYSIHEFDNSKIKLFPKLNGFLKRFYNDYGAREEIVHNGHKYYRTLKYSAKIFPLKPGNLEIDPLHVEEEIIGLSSVNRIDSSIASNKVTVQVNELPKDNSIKGFSGLIGKHEVKLNVKKGKFQINEPIEITFSIEGEGAIEKFELSELIESDLVELFERNSRFEFDLDGTSKKTFKFIYLGKKRGTISAQRKNLVIFNPKGSGFEEIEFFTHPVEIFEEAVMPKEKIKDKGPSNGDDNSKFFEMPIKKLKELIYREGPKIDSSNGNYSIDDDLKPLYVLRQRKIDYLFYLNVALVLLNVIMLSLIFRKYLRFKTPNQEKAILLSAKIKKNGLDYLTLFQLITLLDKKAEDIHPKTLEMIINDSNLSEGARCYFLKLLKLATDQYSEYTLKKNGLNTQCPSYNKKFFKEIQYKC